MEVVLTNSLEHLINLVNLLIELAPNMLVHKDKIHNNQVHQQILNLFNPLAAVEDLKEEDFGVR
jgi:hypothetical protein